MKTRGRKKSKLKLFLIITIVFTLGILLTYQYQKSRDIRRCLSAKVEEPLIAGSRLTIGLTCDNPRFNLSNYRVSLYYSGDNSSFKTKELLEQEYKQYIKIPTELDKNNFYYYFELNYEGKQKRYPSKGTLSTSLNTKGELITESDISLKPLTYEDIKDKKQVNISLDINDQFPVGDISLYYKFNDAKDFTSQNIDYSDSFKASVSVPKDANTMSYYIDIKTPANNLRIPKDRNFLVQDPRFENIKNELLTYASSKNIDLYLGFDDFVGNTILINNTEEISGLSTIKLYVMLEVYQQISDGKLKMTDSVSRYGYQGTLSDGLRQMMIYSNNAATGSLILKVGGTDNINKTLKHYLGEDIKSNVTHTPGYAEGGNNYVTVDDQMKLLKMLYLNEILPDYSKEMIDLMRECSDYFSVKNVLKLEGIAMKTGYSPPNMYDLIGVTELEKDQKYIFSVHAYGKNKSAIKTSIITDLLGILQKYNE